MYRGLLDVDRQSFFVDALGEAAAIGTTVIVILSDTKASPFISGALTPAFDTLAGLLERVHNHMSDLGSYSLVVADRPGGGWKQDKELLTNCQTLLNSGTTYVDLSRIPINVLTTDSRMVRGLQLADLVTGCTTSFIAGEASYSPIVFAAVRPLLRRAGNTVGGRGIKIHPDYRYGNLYHWLLEDSYLAGVQMPRADRPYSTGPAQF
jgi:hypothetical protein